ncbi:hypothetical protein LR948_07435 [Roseivivax sp. GX 12232]|uniref:hypothetical protein n=1 Tax=Roseivivax sp. GX 12232 TaxID=2900547 RepID=UPI001E63FB91|nr:hypothetical protein [Roseivivax sp. GX 12232]MCE0505179.1 hypothetical protein [Roseivivax sp. GX 12232]
MEALIWGGAALSLLGLAGLVYAIVTVARARRTTPDDEALRAVLRRALPINLGALLLSVLGLMMVILGIFLG